MEEETKKRNTDCLYFLASPLTCKKGSECEYRHSDSARLNPRDCWYWLDGSCRNPNCAFRHPPLEGLSGVKPESLYAPSFSATPTSKSNVPCYFYFNSVCTKGEQCHFLHETYLTQKSHSKSVSETVAANNPPENKFFTGDTGPASVELPVNPPTESFVGPIKTSNHHPKEASCSPSTESVVPEFEEQPPVDNTLPSIELTGQLSPYPSSEELVKECVDQELDERWESSPGFDVLVDDGSEQLAYEDDADYQLVQKRESCAGYDFETSAGYDHHSRYPDAGYLYDGPHEDHDHADGIYDADDFYATANYFRKISDLPNEERVFEPIYDSHGQRLLRRVHEVHDSDDVMDLQEYLGKPRRMDARWNSRKRRRSNPYGSRQERPVRRGMYNGSIHSRLTSQVGRCMVNDHDEYEYESNRNYHDGKGWRGQSGTSGFMHSRLRERGRRRHRFPAREEEESARISCGGFDGPKTLAQIKEEKSRPSTEYVKNSMDRIPQLRKRDQVDVDFEGPKPLEELLKQKRSEGPRTSTCSELEHLDNAGLNSDDDDDVFRKRLVHMLS